MSGIASGLQAAGIGSVICKFKSDQGQPVDLQIDRVLHLPTLPCRLLSPQQILKQHYSFGDGFTMNKDHSTLTINGVTKTIGYDPMTNLPLLHAEPGLSTLHKINNLIQDNGPDDNLSFAQRQLLHWMRAAQVAAKGARALSEECGT